MGKISGVILTRGHRTIEQACEAPLPDHALSDRTIVLEGEESEYDLDDEVIVQRATYTVVDIRHSTWPFEFVNAGTKNTANVEVDPSGKVCTSRSVEAGAELLWDYGEHYAFEHFVV